MKRPFWILAGLVAVLLAGWTALTALGASRYDTAVARFTLELGSPALEQLAPPVPPPDENAARYLLESTEAPGLDDEGRVAMVALLDTPLAEWQSPEVEEAKALVGQAGPTLRALHRVAEHTNGSFEIAYTEGANARFPDFLAILDVLRLNDLEARAAAAGGDLPAVSTALEVFENVSRTLDAESLMMATIVSHAVETRRLTLIRELVAAGLLDRTVLAEVAVQLSRHDPVAALRRALRGEGAFVSGIGAIEAVSLPHQTPLGKAKTLLLSPGHRLLQASILEDYTDVAANLDRDWEALTDGMLIAPRTWSLRSPLYVNVRKVLVRTKGMEAAYEVARAAVAQALDPGSRAESDGVTVVLEGDRWVLRADDWQQQWFERLGAETSATPPPFEWRVPVALTLSGGSQAVSDLGDGVGRHHHVSLAIAP